MGSLVSVVVAEIVMQNIEERALATYKRTVPLWLRYVDNTFTSVHKNEIDDFHKHLNRQNANKQFSHLTTLFFTKQGLYLDKTRATSL